MPRGAKTLLLSVFMTACVACGGAASGARMSDTHSSKAAWQRVVDADSETTQRAELDAFLALHPPGSEPRLQVSVVDAASGQKAPIDKALWAAPQNYRVTLSYGDETYVFTPKSRASLEPLFRE